MAGTVRVSVYLVQYGECILSSRFLIKLKILNATGSADDQMTCHVKEGSMSMLAFICNDHSHMPAMFHHWGGDGHKQNNNLADSK